MSEPDRKPRLLLVTPYFFPQNYGGAVRLFDDLLTRSRRIESAVLTENLYAHAEDLPAAGERARKNGYRLYRTERLRLIFTGRSPLERITEAVRFFPQTRAELSRVVNDFKPDVVVSGATYRLGWLMCSVAQKVPVINYVLGEELTQQTLESGPIARYLRRAQRESIQAARTNIVISRFTAEQLKELAEIGDEAIQILPCSVDTELFRPPADRDALRRELGIDGRTTLLTIARLIPRKGIDQVLRALASSKSLPPDWLYLIGGTGIQEQKLRALTAELGLGERVRFLGYLAEDQLPRYYGVADLFVQTNREVAGDTEGFGIVFLEANACGTPVIGGIAGGTADAIEEGVSGLRVDGNDVDAVRSAIERLMGDAELRRDMGATALEHVRAGFSADACASRFEDMVLSIVGKQ